MARKFMVSFVFKVVLLVLADPSSLLLNGSQLELQTLVITASLSPEAPTPEGSRREDLTVPRGSKVPKRRHARCHVRNRSFGFGEIYLVFEYLDA